MAIYKGKMMIASSGSINATSNEKIEKLDTKLNDIDGKIDDALDKINGLGTRNFVNLIDTIELLNETMSTSQTLSSQEKTIVVNDTGIVKFAVIPRNWAGGDVNTFKCFINGKLAYFAYVRPSFGDSVPMLDVTDYVLVHAGDEIEIQFQGGDVHKWATGKDWQYQCSAWVMVHLLKIEDGE